MKLTVNDVWKRPENVPYPSIWHRFERVDKNGKTRKFFIQDITDDMHTFIIDHMVDMFLRDEPLAKSLDLRNDEDSVSSMCELWRSVLPQHMAIVCFEEDPQVPDKPIHFAGCNLTAVTRKDCDIMAAIKFEPRGEPWKKMFQIAIVATKEYDVYNVMGSETYMTAFGISVKDSYRGMGIAQQMLEARTKLCETFNIRATMNSFSNIGAQIAAEHAGFINFITVDYEEAAKKDPYLHFPGVQTKSLKFYYKKYL